MEKYMVSRLWKLLYWTLWAGEFLLLLAGVLAGRVVLCFLAFGSYLASLWLKRRKSQCPACGGALEGNILRPGVKDAACRACGARIQVK